MYRSLFRTTAVVGVLIGSWSTGASAGPDRDEPGAASYRTTHAPSRWEQGYAGHQAGRSDRYGVPPVSGVIHVRPGMADAGRTRYASGYGAPGAAVYQVRPHHGFSPDEGYRGMRPRSRSFGRDARWNGDAGERMRRHASFGDRGDDARDYVGPRHHRFAEGGYGPRGEGYGYAGQSADLPLTVRYGEPPLLPGYAPSEGYANAGTGYGYGYAHGGYGYPGGGYGDQAGGYATGGYAYGPNGGLAVYSPGAYSPGPRIISIPDGYQSLSHVSGCGCHNGWNF